jgi:isopenicillin N synthase-like dioxygenase
MSGTVRTVDFSLYRDGSKEDQLNFSRELLASFDETGFVKVINHPVHDARVQEVFRMVCYALLLALLLTSVGQGVF